MRLAGEHLVSAQMSMSAVYIGGAYLPQRGFLAGARTMSVVYTTVGGLPTVTDVTHVLWGGMTLRC
jgi:hypothetical protein